MLVIITNSLRNVLICVVRTPTSTSAFISTPFTTILIAISIIIAREPIWACFFSSDPLNLVMTSIFIGCKYLEFLQSIELEFCSHCE
ncbi:hypothetical protein HanXRQr2_Chr12g0548311 [Helianthus annuus]|uniref:Uncharacterized protein n=1 Tax=Helianthus annuus TaxID=4232 RepID=A0A9K3MWK9_HELAN|nr:hypothetical protein HanXRQr2_Chr12g0548311 [Helianthus annuus]KAJ0448510.1 hypothetical protein HanHA89_Chr17g0717751 [Helianthus annuus]KAJ0489903.1 hypothetical protein HanHA300_Chr12g0449261 [Helianthus annuus]KAJ0493929.1 hypothetical protein HanIR_Chr12g0591641 [Helianthus annuus]KAJ0633389.1 hypothetical protein HanLR1_Chr17g0676201 [Helianthus annuus]